MSNKSDLRSTHRDAQRFASQKAKWAHGVATPSAGRHPSKPRPMRVSDLPGTKTRVSGSSSKAVGSAREEIQDVTAEWPALQVVLGTSPGAYSNASTSSEEDEEQEAIRMVAEYEQLEEVYGAEGTMPESGSQVLHGALKKAIDAFEDKETVRLVKSEWAMLDEGGEEVGFVPEKKRKERGEELCGGEFEMV
ncbi:Hypothetical protein D9617_15g043930 [Elsinoe fawcettii]|nr:Hypothetical protein D9617_15g043930 [Elsinoe fawcettii]